MNERCQKRDILLWALRILLSAACVAMLAFIFSNSFKTGEKSAAQSSQVVDVVQQVAQAVAPQSPIATATGADYEMLHTIIRVIAHFSEFFVLGVSFMLCAYSYTQKTPWLFFPLGGVLLVPALDELVQLFVSGRGAEWTDFFTDAVGGACGVVLALLAVVLVGYSYRILWKKRERARLGLEKGAEV